MLLPPNSDQILVTQRLKNLIILYTESSISAKGTIGDDALIIEAVTLKKSKS